MKKLDAILQGCDFEDRLLELREKTIKRNLEAAKDSVESARVNAEIDYENLCQKLGLKDVNYETIINQMITRKEVIISAEATLKAIAEIEEDLASEVN